VLAILAVVTAMATRVISHVEDQKRYESSQHGLDELQAAILGSPEDRAADGTRTVSGFVADLGRLPRTVLTPDLDGHGASGLTLQELWVAPPAPALFNLRPAVDNGVPTEDRDAQVLVPGGWRGPYLQLSTGAHNLTDGWGNGYSSPTVPPDAETAQTTGYARLRDGDDHAISTEGQAIRIVRHLGANGAFEAADAGYDQDQAVAFPDERFLATIKGNVEVLDEDHTILSETGDKIVVKVFGPDPADPTKIVLFKSAELDITPTTNPVAFTIPNTSLPVVNQLTIGPRVIRAYYKKSGETDASRASAVKTATLRAGVNQLDLTIDRAFTRLPVATP